MAFALWFVLAFVVNQGAIAAGSAIDVHGGGTGRYHDDTLVALALLLLLGLGGRATARLAGFDVTPACRGQGHSSTCCFRGFCGVRWLNSSRAAGECATLSQNLVKPVRPTNRERKDR